MLEWKTAIFSGLRNLSKCQGASVTFKVLSNGVLDTGSTLMNWIGVCGGGLVSMLWGHIVWRKNWAKSFDVGKTSSIRLKLWLTKWSKLWLSVSSFDAVISILAGILLIVEYVSCTERTIPLTATVEIVSDFACPCFLGDCTIGAEFSGWTVTFRNVRPFSTTPVNSFTLVEPNVVAFCVGNHPSKLSKSNISSLLDPETFIFRQKTQLACS